MGNRILIVEDNESIANLEKRHLEKDGFSVELASSGREAIEKINGAEPPDLLILDYNLPDMSGVDLMQMLRQRGLEIPSVIVTAAGSEQVAVSAMKLGAKDYVVKERETIKQLPQTCREILKNLNLEQENERLIAELREANKRLDELSKKDDLTGIFNRRYLMESLQSEVSRSRRYKTPLSFAIFDIDRFKSVNDTYGHGTGDHVLKQFARLIRERLRTTDIFGRYGGEEFGLVLTETGAESASLLCEEIRELVEGYAFGYEHSPIRITTSAGVSCIAENIDTGKLVELADRGLYRAKEAGRNRVFVAGPE